MDSILSWFIKTDFVKAQILAVVRHIVTAIGVALVTHGLANDSMIQDLLGLATTAVSFYLSQLDVKSVDKKIAVALNTPSPQGLTEDQEKKETALLNQLQNIKPGV